MRRRARKSLVEMPDGPPSEQGSAGLRAQAAIERPKRSMWVTRFLKVLPVLPVALRAIATAFVLYDRITRPVLRLELKDEIGGYELGVFNEGRSLAKGINVDVFAWQVNTSTFMPLAKLRPSLNTPSS